MSKNKMTSVVGDILKWTDKKFDEAQDENEKHPWRKAGISGFVKGLIDGAVFAYPILLIGCIYWRKKAQKK